MRGMTNSEVVFEQSLNETHRKTGTVVKSKSKGEIQYFCSLPVQWEALIA